MPIFFLFPLFLYLYYSEKFPRFLTFTCSKCLLRNNFWERIYPGTTQIFLTINVNTRIQSRNYQYQLSKGTILSLYIKIGNRINTIHDLSTPLPQGLISLAIDINRKLATIDPKLKKTILNLFIKTGNRECCKMNLIEVITILTWLSISYD